MSFCASKLMNCKNGKKFLQIEEVQCRLRFETRKSVSLSSGYSQNCPWGGKS